MAEEGEGVFDIPHGGVRGDAVIASEAKQSCVREDVLSAGCESPPHGAIPCEAESNCVVQLWSGRGLRSGGGRRGGEQQEANA